MILKHKNWDMRSELIQPGIPWKGYKTFKYSFSKENRILWVIHHYSSIVIIINPLIFFVYNKNGKWDEIIADIKTISDIILGNVTN